MLKLALTARWITALVFCLSLAAGFALMAQWQVGRTILENSSNETWSKVEVVELESVAKPNSPFTFSEISTTADQTVLTEVRTEFTLEVANAVLISNRIQVNGDRGYWVVVPAQTKSAKLFVAAGFIKDTEQAKTALAKIKKLVVVQALLPHTGRYLPGEAPVESIETDIYDSLSIAQLINKDNIQTESVYTGFMALTEDNTFSSIDGVDLVTIGMPQSDSQVNWLSAFYAIEWSVFAGFAVFMWWRLLADAYKKQQSALLAQ
jgi:cytochrome oxidase assembly protein ShyY1